ADYSTWGIDEEIDQRNLGILRRILENAAEHPGAAGTVDRQIGDFYAAARDEPAIERAGLAAGQPELGEIPARKSTQAGAGLVRAWHVRGIGVLFELVAGEDLKASDTNIAYVGQGGLGLPDNGYYTREDVASKLLRTRYRDHVARMLDLLGDADSKQEAGWILA